MGVASAENSDTAADMTTAKPRERQFQVVPVPGKFTRGRWQCWDYRDDKPDVSEKILDFTDKSEKNVAPSTVNAEAQSNTNATSNITSQLSADCASAAHPIIEQPQTILKAQQQPAGNAVVNAVNATQNQADISLSTSTSTQQALAHKESSTIVVTSIAPAPVTPVHRTSSSSIDIDDTTNVPDNADNLANIQSATDAELSRQTSIASFHDGSMNSNPATALNKIDATIDDSLATGNLPGGPNVVAIDNKIEQAMDLVKTHLTFAVREEVELLRSTIVELEAKVAQLESQNQVLKQFAPAEVVANLALLVQNAQQQKQLQQLQQQAQIVTLPPVSGTSLVPPVISSAQPVVVNATPLTTHPFQLGQVASDELQSSVGVIPVPNTSTATDSNSNQITSTSMPSATDITTTSQLSSTLDSMVVNLSSSTSSTNTAAK